MRKQISYWFDTTLQTIPAKSYTDSTGTIKHKEFNMNTLHLLWIVPLSFISG
jgi:hypothetical protein